VQRVVYPRDSGSDDSVFVKGTGREACQRINTVSTRTRRSLTAV